MAGLTSRQVNLALELLMATSLATGVLSWAVELAWARPLTFVHAVSGFSMVLIAPLKIRGPVRAGVRRGGPTRWISMLFGLVVIGAIALGATHSIGLWHGVGYWSALWSHLLLGFVSIPLILWHVISRPVRPGRVDISRRAVVSGAAVTAGAAGLIGVQEVGVRLLRLDGATRAGTGSHERASFDPERMPVVSWFDDTVPSLDLSDWQVHIGGEIADLEALASEAKPLRAVLDCTGGWRSTQNWDVVPLADVVRAQGSGRSIQVTSATGYSRLFSPADAHRVYVCTGYDGRPLSKGHGAPLRLVVPGRRGPWWVKWITDIDVTDRPAWLQSPFPPT